MFGSSTGKLKTSYKNIDFFKQLPLLTLLLQKEHFQGVHLKGNRSELSFWCNKIHGKPSTVTQLRADLILIPLSA